jgi:hypothetical protein
MVNWDKVDEWSGGGGTVEPGTYNVKVAKVQDKGDDKKPLRSKSTDRLMINLTLKIIGGENAGRNVFDSFVFEHEDQKKLGSCLGRVKNLMKSLGLEKYVTGESEPKELHGKMRKLTFGKVCSAKVTVQKATEEQLAKGWKDKNRVDKYSAAENVSEDSEPWDEEDGDEGSSFDE